MSARTRKHFSGPFKAKVALEAIRAVKTVNEIAQEYGVHPTQVGSGRRNCTNRRQTSLPPSASRNLLTRRRVRSGSIPRLGGQDGTGLAQKKVGAMPVAARTGWVSPHEPLTLTRQCELTGVTRSTIYARHPAATPNEQELTLLGMIDAEYTRHPFYGSRKIRQYLRGVGYQVNRKRVQRLMGILGLAGMAPGPNTSRPHPQHRVYPYLLRGVAVTRPNQVWSTDITSLRLARGVVSLVAVIDWYSRNVLSWR